MYTVFARASNATVHELAKKVLFEPACQQAGVVENIPSRLARRIFLPNPERLPSNATV